MPAAPLLSRNSRRAHTSSRSRALASPRRASRQSFLNANDQRSLRVTVKLAQRIETVTVTGEAPLVSESPAVAFSPYRILSGRATHRIEHII